MYIYIYIMYLYRTYLNFKDQRMLLKQYQQAQKKLMVYLLPGATPGVFCSVGSSRNTRPQRVHGGTTKRGTSCCRMKRQMEDEETTR